MNKTDKALKLAEAYIAGMKWSEEADEAIAAIREALADHVEQNLTMVADHSGGANKMVAEPKCSEHPDAPHGFDRNASHNAGRYVCECEGWSPDEVVKYPGCDYCNDELFSGRKCKCCGKVFIENVEQEIDDLRQQNAALKAVIDAWNNVEPVKQEPVAVISESAIGLVKLHSNGACLPFGTQLYAAPVHPMQEPVAWRYNSNGDWIYKDRKVWDAAEPLYAAPVQPVKQEPVVWTATRLWNRKDTWSCPADIEKDLLYAAPVDAKAIRAEALEEAAKMAEAYVARSIGIEMAAAIRGIK